MGCVRWIWRRWWRGGVGGRTWICHLVWAVIRICTNIFNYGVADFVIDLLVLNSNCNMTDLLLAGNALLFWHLLVHYVALSVHDRLALVHNLCPVLGHINGVAFQLGDLLALLSLSPLKAGSLALLQREKELLPLSTLLFSFRIEIVGVVKILKVLIPSGLTD